jgi:serine/threonine protein kinase/tetratricopeptide (TPR) repeat protein
MIQTIGHYRVTGQLGEGGMGVVYEGHDDRLGRTVAIKVIRASDEDPVARNRLWREARAAASLSHPNVCQLYEVGEDNGTLFIAMERLEGESLAQRLGRGSLPVAEAGHVALAVLAALEALHARGLIHRDLKPTNVFLTPHGVKLLDFGLVRQIATEPDRTDPGITLPGTILGTPRYMAPEQVLGDPVDARTDLFSVGAMLFEMLSGAPPYDAPSTAGVLERILTERPPALTGSPGVAAVDRVIHKALSRRPELRYADAHAMVEDLRLALRFEDSAAVQVRMVKRLVVLPFRLLRADADTDFLAVSLPDAITASLSGFDAVVLRSSLAAARFATASPDLRQIATELDVDSAVTGTLVRAGDRVRVTWQLLDVPDGTVRLSRTSEGTLNDLFELQDDLAKRIVSALELPLTGMPPGRDAPASGRAHELYLRANQLADNFRTWARARALYEEALVDDPGYAPAWARLGRMCRVMAKFGASTEPEADLAQAVAAFKRALELNPDLPLAHNLYSQLEVEMGRGREAMDRLLRRVHAHGADPQVFAGLVHACRYCGLLEASIAAHEHVRRFDQQLPTGVMLTLWLMGEYQRAIDAAEPESEPLVAIILATMGRESESIALLRRVEEQEGDSREGRWARVLRHAVARERDQAIQLAQGLAQSAELRDPEVQFFAARVYARLPEPDTALNLLSAAVNGGYSCATTLEIDPWLDSLRGSAAFDAIVETARRQRREALATFEAAGGERLLGVAPMALAG